MSGSFAPPRPLRSEGWHRRIRERPGPRKLLVPRANALRAAPVGARDGLAECPGLSRRRGRSDLKDGTEESANVRGHVNFLFRARTLYGRLRFGPGTALRNVRVFRAAAAAPI